MKNETKKQTWTKGTKFLLDFMFYAGIGVTLSLPWSIGWLKPVLPEAYENYWLSVAIYFVLGVAAELLLWELKKIFRTVQAEDCFVWENVRSLRRMGNWSFFIAAVSMVRNFIYVTIAMGVVSLVFIIAGLFSKVLSYVFEQAVQFKEENELTI